MMNQITVKDLYELKPGDEQALDLGDFTVTVRRRSGDWWACLNGHEGVWCCGGSLDYVIGYTVVTYLSYLSHANNPTHHYYEQARRIVAKP